jgi:hypothetical protein
VEQDAEVIYWLKVEGDLRPVAQPATRDFCSTRCIAEFYAIEKDKRFGAGLVARTVKP